MRNPSHDVLLLLLIISLYQIPSLAADWSRILLQNQLGHRNQITAPYDVKDMRLIRESEADFIFPDPNGLGLRFLFTSYASICTIIVIFHTDKSTPFLFMSHMNHKNTWESLDKFANRAKLEFTERYKTEWNPEALRASIISGDYHIDLGIDGERQRDPKLKLHKSWGISLSNIDDSLFKTSIKTINDLVADGLTGEIDINQLKFYFSFSKGDIPQLTQSQEIPCNNLDELRGSLYAVLDDYFHSTKIPPHEMAKRVLEGGLEEALKIKTNALKEASYTVPLLRDKSCNYCLKQGPVKHCTGCKMLKYCDKDCQTKDWPRHKEECQKIKKQLKLN